MVANALKIIIIVLIMVVVRQHPGRKVVVGSSVKKVYPYLLTIDK
jgi:hypothetical protein